ncbi:hypothetical protein M5362_03120 [Streptomyces sp. Je 1-79]|uniref:hypothetical protein n=1 Tax=Streptomyces sp. Je 1-79 TaxID=2943847 RepID=UPI0021A29951|nr:hypothetical protein [Streptomyces sp. Je 1-79]MCT4352126.1 hypothetical protein [Streptomyces sp. Je 1-79]
MKKFLEIVGVIVLLGGISGVVRELTGWFPFLGYTRFLTENVWFLDGRELMANVAIAVVGFAIVMIADARRRT